MRISIYIDGANFLGGLKSINKKYKDWNFDFKRFVNKITEERELISVYYYVESRFKTSQFTAIQQQENWAERSEYMPSFPL